ncbi:MAG: hypothetical protein AAGA65_27720, partial [Actinomycetota bacterium]
VYEVQADKLEASIANMTHQIVDPLGGATAEVAGISVRWEDPEQTTARVVYVIRWHEDADGDGGAEFQPIWAEFVEELVDAYNWVAVKDFEGTGVEYLDDLETQFHADICDY